MGLSVLDAFSVNRYQRLKADQYTPEQHLPRTQGFSFCLYGCETQAGVGRPGYEAIYGRPSGTCCMSDPQAAT